MEITPRLLSLAVALVFVFASPYAAYTQSAAPPKPPSPSAPKAAVPVALKPAQAPAPKAAAPVALKPAQAPAPKAAAPAAPKPAPAPAPAPAAVAAGPQLEPQGYAYDPEGRRDPFVSLLRRGADTQKPTLGARPQGLAGLETSEVTLKGIVTSLGSFVGIMQGADNKTYIVRAGDKLFDGAIRAITQTDMVITQQVNDPLSLEKQREVRKVLRQTEEAK